MVNITETTFPKLREAVVLTDIHGRITFLSATAKDLTGWSQAEMAGQHLCTSLFDPDAGFQHRLQAALSAPSEWRLDLGNQSVRTQDGRILTIQGSISPVRDSQGTLTGLVVVFCDMSAHRQVERTLREYTQRLEHLHTLDQVILSGQPLNYIASTALTGMRQLVHYAQAQIVIFYQEQDCIEVLAADPETEAPATLTSRLPLEPFLANQAQRTLEVCCKLSVPIMLQDAVYGVIALESDNDDGLHPLEMHVVTEIARQLSLAMQQARLLVQTQRHTTELEQRVTERTNELTATNKRLHQEIAERKHAEKALTQAFEKLEELNQQIRRSRDMLQTLIEGLDDGLLLLGADERVLAANQAMATMLNISPTVLIGQQWAVVCRDTTKFPGEQALLTLRDGRSRRQRERYVNAQDQTVMLDIQTLPLFDMQQQVDQVILHTIDVTERTHFEALVVENERFAASGQLAATIAHEINTPLQAIQTFLYLADESSDVQRRQYLRLAEEEIERISRIVQQLLGLYRDRMRTFDSLDVNALIERVLLVTGSMLAKHGIDVEIDVLPNLPPLWGDVDHLIQVLLNLILNAVGAMPNGGKLRFRTEVRTPQKRSASKSSMPLHHHDPGSIDLSDQAMVFEISDTGTGIASDIQAHIFDPFFTTKPHGSGLGLTVSRKIIAQHGGRITVVSTPGDGTTFTVELPLEPGAHI